MTIYGKRFFRRRGGKLKRRERKVAEILFELWSPAWVYDAGCAIGSFLERFQELGCQIQGSDIGASEARPYMSPRVAPFVEEHDLSKPLGGRPIFDLILCVEVAEHLEPEGSEVLVRNLLSLAGPRARVFFTAAKPRQPGKGHINCRPSKDWKELFEKAGGRYLPHATSASKALLKSIRDPLRIRKNLMIFGRA